MKIQGIVPYDASLNELRWLIYMEHYNLVLFGNKEKGI